MKPINRILLCVMLFVSAASFGASAQWRYGLDLGGSFPAASLKNAGDCTIDNGSGFRGGVAFQYSLGETGVAFDTGVLYNRFSMKLKGTGMENGRSFGRNFLEIPVHAQYNFWLSGIGGVAAPMIFTGPSLLISLDGKSDLLAQKRLQMGWDAGIGFNIINFIELTGGYRFGIGNAADSFAPYPEAKLRTSGWFVSAKIMFDF